MSPQRISPERCGGSSGTSDEAASGQDPIISVRKLTKTYGDGAVRAVDGVSFDIERGTVVGLLGPNGAGKTTTIKSLLGLIVPTGGDVTIAGVDPHEDPREAYASVAAMLEGARNTYWRLTVRENLEFFARLAGENPRAKSELIETLLQQLDLAGVADKPVNELSRGQKQKVSLATTLSQDADVVFLDEPTLGLDVESSLQLRAELARLAREQDLTVVLSSHDMDLIEALCDRVVLLNGGTVVADDTVDNLLEFFQTQAYKVTVNGRVDRSVQHEIDAEYEVSSWTERADRTTLEVALPNGNAIGSLVDSIVDAGLEILAVNTVEPDFEKVFLSLTEDRSGRAGVGPGPVAPQTNGGDHDA